MFRYILPLGAICAILPLQAQTASTTNNENHNSQPATVMQATSNRSDSSRSDAKLQASDDVSRALNDANNARTAIANNNTQQAMNDVNDAMNFLHQAQSAAPNQKLVPLYTETDSYSVMGPILATRNATTSNRLNQPGQTVSSNRYQTTQNSNKQAAGPNDLTVQRAYGEYTSVSLDTQLALNHLQATKLELQRGNVSQADAGLKATQDAVIVASEEANLPLLRARENLMLAKSSANSGDYAEARVALRAARRALDNYAGLNGSHAADARTLAQQIVNYDKNASQSTADLSTRINNWWGQTTDWTVSTSNNSL